MRTNKISIILTILLVMFLAFTNNKAYSQNTCGTAVNISPSPAVTFTSCTSTDSVYWLSFNTGSSDTNIQIVTVASIPLGSTGAHCHEVVLFGGICGHLQLINAEYLPEITGANEMRLDVSHLLPSTTYYLLVGRVPVQDYLPGCNPSSSGECNPLLTWTFSVCCRSVNILVPPDSGSESPALNQLYYENRGQIENLGGSPEFDIAAYTAAASPALYCKDSVVSFVYTRTHKDPSITDTAARVDMVLTGTNTVTPQRLFKMEENYDAGYLNYFLNYTPGGVPAVFGYSRLVYQGMYNNIDMDVYSNSFGTKLYFVCYPASGTGGSPGNPSNIELEFKGATSVNVTGGGGLNVVSRLGDINFAPGYAYEDSAGIVVPMHWQATFTSISSNTVAFNIGAYNTAEPLIIEVDRGRSTGTYPCIANLCWSTYFGGTNPNDEGVFNDVTHDAQGNVYATGYTTSANFPVHSGVQTSFSGNQDAVAVKFSNSDKRVWATYYGGNNNTAGNGIGVDRKGEVFFTGYTYSTNFPEPRVQPAGAYAQAALGGGSGSTNAFIVKLGPSGGTCPWATYYGGSGNEKGDHLAVDTTNNYVYIVGEGAGTATPLYTEAGAYNNSDPGGGLIAKFNTSGAQQWGTTIGCGTAGDATYLKGCVTDPSGNFYITGNTTDLTTYPLTAGCLSFAGGPWSDAVATKFNAANAIAWSTYFGGDGQDDGNAIAVDASGNAYITGYTQSPASSGSIEIQPDGSAYLQPLNGNGVCGFCGVGNAFIAEFAATNGSLLWSTYFGGAWDIEAFGITIDADNNLFITGPTNYNVSTGYSGFVFPNTEPVGAYLSCYIGTVFSETFLAGFNSNRYYFWGTYLDTNYGGSQFSQGYGITDYGASQLYVIGVAGYAYLFANPGNGAWFQNTDLFDSSTTYIPYISSFNMSGISTGVNTITKTENEIKVYPNPTSQNVTVEMNLTTEQDMEFSLYNLLGEQVYCETVKENAGTVYKQILLSLLPNGDYILQVIAGNNVYHAKVTKLE